MYRLLCFSLCLVFLLALPVSASETTTPTADSEAITDIPEDTPMALLITGSLSGGYYFICDCSLGDGLKFYVPLEWAHNALAIDSSGAPVNMSTSTCYAYCEDYPSYTFSCSRFGTFTYRSTDYSTTDLEVTNIADTNIQFLEDESYRLSDYDMLVLIASLLFLSVILPVVLRRR